MGCDEAGEALLHRTGAQVAVDGDGAALAHPFTRALWQALPGNGFRVAEGV